MLAAPYPPMTVALGTAVEVGKGIAAGAAVGAAIAALEGAGAGSGVGAAQGERAAFASGKGTGASWLAVAKGSGPEAGSKESFKASLQSMLRAWGVVARSS